MSDIHVIPDYSRLPSDACHWPACATPVCPRGEDGDGSCPLKDDFIVACCSCGAAVGVSNPRCPICDTGERAG